MAFKHLYLLILSLFLCFAAIAQTSLNSIPVIDKEKSYPEYSGKLNIEERYIPLETSKYVLLGQDFRVYHVSVSLIMGVNWHLGDVVFFSMHGKVVSHFNKKGALGYNRIGYATYDNDAHELYIMDKVLRKIFVFTQQGELKRSFKMPKNLTFKRIENFNDKLLLAWHEHAMGPIEPEQQQPYVFLSKQDGSIVSKLNIHLKKANPRYLMSGNICYTLGNNEEGNCKFGSDFYLSNKSMDTIYHLTQSKVLTPVFSQKPSVFSDSHLIAGVVTVTDEIIVFSVYPFDLEEEKKRNEAGISVNGKTRTKFLLYEKSSGRIYRLKNWNYVSNHLDAPVNTSLQVLQAYELVEKYKLGLLQGELKEVASQLKIDDNPVIKITLFK
ncbi:6-bladed beta-propeller [Draconibacterium orientale]|uniref:6-bladed beta-propeller n=1 Tax=Draconibacterium orientale TaxID=1168034 RepID=UPI0029C067B8|nr:6-bladed beta-propeller [Draconibacterium orientale]